MLIRQVDKVSLRDQNFVVNACLICMLQ